MRDHYEVLGVARHADQAAVMAAFAKQQRQIQPSAERGDQSAETRLKELTNAFVVLSDDRLRRAYDDGVALASRPVHSPSRIASFFGVTIFSIVGSLMIWMTLVHFGLAPNLPSKKALVPVGSPEKFEVRPGKNQPTSLDVENDDGNQFKNESIPTRSEPAGRRKDTDNARDSRLPSEHVRLASSRKTSAVAADVKSILNPVPRPTDQQQTGGSGVAQSNDIKEAVSEPSSVENPTNSPQRQTMASTITRTSGHKRRTIVKPSSNKYRRAPQQSFKTKWKLLSAQRSHRFRVSELSVDLIASCRKCRWFRVVALRHDIRIHEARLHYKDGTSRKSKLVGVIRDETKARTFKANERMAQLTRLSVVHQTEFNLHGLGRIEVWGLEQLSSDPKTGN